MINRATATSLKLPNHTIRSCRDLYEKLAHDNPDCTALKRTLSDHQSDAQTLNKLWWVLNYHAESFDMNRKLRAWVEARLEVLATEKTRRRALQA